MIIIFRINDIIDLPLVDNITFQKLCKIRDVIIDLRENRVYALTCNGKFFSRSLGAVLFRNVTSISQNNVSVTDKIKIINLKELRMEKGCCQSYQSILGKPVTGFRGEALGIIRDILIDTNSGIIEAYELSEGYLDDFLKGRHIVETDGRSILPVEREYPLYHR
ncbi:MAG TPA: PRC-barrel domain-containing protein [Bacillota bacterium]|nr:PRC-barrel domain-containing protein [Bacillota bacterium]HPL52727.1 PRC-barrel domain-containing protein [Bacillota bacterium]